MSDLPTIEPSSSASGSLVHPEGKLCKWCGTDPATTIIYGWDTCLACSAGGPKVRVQRWLANHAPREKRRR